MYVLERFDPDRIRALRDGGEYFWLDLLSPADEEIDELAAMLDLPPLAVEDTHEFSQRAKIDDYGDRLLIVFYGARGGDHTAELVEVHMHLAARQVVTVRRAACAALDPLRTAHVHSDQELVYRILDALSESVLSMLRELEGEVSGLEQRAFEQPRDADRRRIVQLRGRLFRLLQVVVPQRDMLDGGDAVIERVLGMEGDRAHHPFRDVGDDLVLAVNLVTYCRELLAEALSVHLQATSNRLSEVATRLTVLAAIFIPLTLVTGFFGQNFTWLTDHVDSLTAFLIWGVGGLVVPGVAIGVGLWRAGYLNRDGQ